MVKLGIHCAMMFLRSFALGDINIDAHHPLRTAIAVVGNKAARIDPPNLAARPNNAIIRTRSSGCTPHCHSLRAISAVPSGRHQVLIIAELRSQVSADPGQASLFRFAQLEI